MGELIDAFRGDNDRLIACIEALLDLDAAKALVPHGIGGHARGLLSAAGVRLAVKDREIAELRKAFERAEADVQVLHRERDDALSTVAELAAALARREAEAVRIKAERDAAEATGFTALAERDEARECVGRLCEALRPFAEKTPIEPGGQLIGLMREDFTSARAALAATPEHLRNA